MTKSIGKCIIDILMDKATLFKLVNITDLEDTADTVHGVCMVVSLFEYNTFLRFCFKF